MSFRNILLLLAVFFIHNVSAQPPSTEDEFELAYQKRIKKEYVNNVYIPKDLADAFIQLNRLIDEDSKKKFLSVPDSIAAKKLHFSLGRWMIHNWGFYEGSRFSHYLKGLGIFFPDDMAKFIIITYHRNLTKSELKVKELMESIQKAREKEKEAKKMEGVILKEEKRIRPHD